MPILSSIGTALGGGIVKSLFNGIGKEVTDWWGRRKRVAEAKAEAEAQIALKKATADIEWDQIMAEASKSSWKDEFWTVVLAVPLILVFFPPTQPFIKSGFAALDNSVPDWYLWALGAAIGAAFGIRKISDILGRTRK